MTYDIAYREADGILVCRMYGFMDADMARRLGADLLVAQAAARAKAGSLRSLIDNREGHVAAPEAAAALAQQFRTTVRPGDRSAILVANSLNRMQAKRTVMTEHEIFISENEAIEWLLSAGEAEKAA